MRNTLNFVDGNCGVQRAWTGTDTNAKSKNLITFYVGSTVRNKPYCRLHVKYRFTWILPVYHSARKFYTWNLIWVPRTVLIIYIYPRWGNIISDATDLHRKYCISAECLKCPLTPNTDGWKSKASSRNTEYCSTGYAR